MMMREKELSFFYIILPTFEVWYKKKCLEFRASVSSAPTHLSFASKQDKENSFFSSCPCSSTEFYESCNDNLRLPRQKEKKDIAIFNEPPLSVKSCGEEIWFHFFFSTPSPPLSLFLSSIITPFFPRVLRHTSRLTKKQELRQCS